MKKFSFTLILAAVLALFMSPPSHAVGPIFVNLVPVSGLPAASAFSDSTYSYVIQGSNAAAYRRANGPQWKTYLGISNFTVVDTVSGLTAVVLDTLYCSTAGAIVDCKMLGATGTSNGTAHALVPISFPAAWKPVTAQLVTLAQITDTSTVFYSVKATVATTGGVTLTNNGTAFKNTGTFTLTAGTSFRYNIQ